MVHSMFQRTIFWVSICLLTLFLSISNVAAQPMNYETNTTVRVPTQVTVASSFSVNVIVSFTVPSTINRLFGLEASLFDIDQNNYVDASQILVSGQVKCDAVSPGSCLTVDPVFLALNLQCAGKTPCNGATLTISFKLKAPNTTKTWHLRAESKFVPVAFNGSTYYPTSETSTGSPSRAEFIVAVVGVRDTATLTVILPNPVWATVDGTEQPNGTMKLSVKFGNQTISVPSTVEFDNLTRLRFAGWVDGERNSNRTLNIHADITLSVRYVKQYQLAVVSNVGDSSGSGWYDEGTTANYSVPSSVEPMDGLLGLLGGKWVFSGWYENDTQPVNQALVGSIYMNTPHQLTGQWRGDYTEPLSILGILIVAIIGSIIYATYARVHNRNHSSESSKSVRPTAQVSDSH